MNKKISVGMAISLIAIACMIAITLTYSYALNTFESRMSAITDRESTYDLINELDTKIRQKYYGDISEDRLRLSIAKGFIDGLGDENCEFFPVKEWEIEKDRAAGYDFGLGIEVTRTGEGEMRVTRVQSGSPAHRGGLKIGDIIYMVGSESVEDIGYDRALQTISQAASDVSLSIERDGSKLENAIALTKTRYTIASVEYGMLEDRIGEIIIYSFNSLTPEQFNAALSNLQKKDIKALVIDLRDNSGGSYKAAADILDTLVGSGRLMIVTDKKGEQTAKYMSDNNSVDLIYSVLVDADTKGAAELFASALCDFTDCDVVGETTAGQREVLEDFVLSDGSAIRISTGTWSTPKGGILLENGGVQPNFQTKLTSYQKENMRLLSKEEEPFKTALDRIRSKLKELDEEEEEREKARKESARQNETSSADVSKSDSAAEKQEAGAKEDNNSENKGESAEDNGSKEDSSGEN